MKRKFKQKNNGFTLVETLVAISIFTVSVLAMLSVLAQGISDVNFAKRKVIASYLAQEGIEYIRNLRDTYVLYDAGGAQTGWNSFNTKLTNASCTAAGNGCYFNGDAINFSDNTQPMIDIAIAACGSSCPELKYDSTNGKYNYATGGLSGYTRKITITQTGSPVYETKIISTVSWTQGSGAQSIVFSENLFNWIE